MLLKDINFPIFKIRNIKRIYTENKITYIETIKNTWVLDNKNLNYDTLAKRRLHISEDVYPLNLVIFNIAQLLRDKSANKLYIDNLGNIFKYKKTKYVPLKYKKIKKVLKLENRSAFIVKDIPNPIFVSEFEIRLFEMFNYGYIGLLYTQYGILYYELSSEFKKNSRRMI